MTKVHVALSILVVFIMTQGVSFAQEQGSHAHTS